MGCRKDDFPQECGSRTLGTVASQLSNSTHGRPTPLETRFVALTTEITEQLKGAADSSKLDEVTSHAKEVQHPKANSRSDSILGRIRTGLPWSELGHTLSTYAEDAMSGYFAEKQSAANFKRSWCRNWPSPFGNLSGNKPTVVLIDELDRCRPSYAIELLETAKHIFGVDNVVFVLAVNREELAHSVKALYGSEFGANGYLGRFFDIDFRLPAPNRQAFIRNMLSGVGVYQFFEETSDQFAREQGKDVCDPIITLFLSSSDLSLRSIGQSLHRFAVVLSSLGK